MVVANSSVLKRPVYRAIETRLRPPSCYTLSPRITTRQTGTPFYHCHKPLSAIGSTPRRYTTRQAPFKKPLSGSASTVRLTTSIAGIVLLSTGAYLLSRRTHTTDSMSSKLIPANPSDVMVIRDITPNVVTFSVPFARFGRLKIGGRGTLGECRTSYRQIRRKKLT